RRFGKQGEESVKPIKVYQRRRFGKQGEEPVEAEEEPQPNDPADPDAPVPSLSSELSPSGSSHILEHEDLHLPLALRLAHRTHRPVNRYGFEHDIANFMAYSHISPAYKMFIAS